MLLVISRQFEARIIHRHGFKKHSFASPEAEATVFDPLATGRIASGAGLSAGRNLRSGMKAEICPMRKPGWHRGRSTERSYYHVLYMLL
jgi:hypothetical protein